MSGAARATIAVDGRVLVHQPTGVFRYLEGILVHRPSGPARDDRLEVYVDRRPPRALPGRPDAVHVLRWPLPGGDPAWRQLRLGPAMLSPAAADVLFCPFYTVPLLSRVPAVVTIHDLSFLAHPEWFRPAARAAFALVAPSAHRAAAILTVSRFSADEIVRLLDVPARRVHVVPSAVDHQPTGPPTPEQEMAARSVLGFAGPYLLHLGAVHERRRPDLVVGAFALLAERHPDLHLVVAGPTLPPAPDVLALARAAGVADRVHRLEWVPEEVRHAVLARARALLYLSVYEGFGLPALEAAAAGVPVVALRRASLPEVLGDAAAWVDEPSAEAVARAAAPLLADEAARADLVAAGRERARRFGWERTSRDVFDLLRSVAGA